MRDWETSLSGVRVVVTRAAKQADSMVTAFVDAGATVAKLPLIEVVSPADRKPLDAALRRLRDYDILAFASPNAVAAVLPRLTSEPPPIAVVGPATAAAVRDTGFAVTTVAERADGGGLAESLVGTVRDQRVLLPRAADARPELLDRLEQAGARVDAVEAYAKRLPLDARSIADRLFDRSPLGWVTFTSPRVVANFVSLLGDAWPARRRELHAAAIGPTTARSLSKLGIDPAVAKRPTPSAMVEAVVAAVVDAREVELRGAQS